mgnify:CR=1 FL=1
MNLTIGKNYTFPYEKGMLLIAYPNYNNTVNETNFEFDYWIAGYKESWIDRIYYFNFRWEYGQKVLLYLIIGVSSLVVILVGFAICFCKKMTWIIVEEDSLFKDKKLDLCNDHEDHSDDTSQDVPDIFDAKLEARYMAE